MADESSQMITQLLLDAVPRQNQERIRNQRIIKGRPFEVGFERSPHHQPKGAPYV
jgi:hypothetical protein